MSASEASVGPPGGPSRGTGGAATNAVGFSGRPRLRGWVHAAAVLPALAATWLLWHAAAPEASRRASVLVFGAGLVALYAASSLYHVPRWRERAHRVLSRLDASMIQLFIAASFTPFAVHALDGRWRSVSLAVAWTIAVGGVAIVVSPLRGPRWLVGGAYLAFGWLGAVPVVKLFTVLAWPGSLLVAVGGVLYTVGAVVYVRRRPDPWPRWFGYHEVFHVLVVAAGAAHYLAVWRYVLPLG